MAAPELFRRMIAAFDDGDTDAMGALLADDVVAYVTNADGGADRVDGRDAYLARLPDVGGADYAVTVTQAVTVADGQVLAMVEVKAAREGRTLHNHAAFLATVRDGVFVEIWMVDALPAYSDEFWS
jgi:ketosteroid isomerase-like protein